MTEIEKKKHLVSFLCLLQIIETIIFNDTFRNTMHWNNVKQAFIFKIKHGKQEESIDTLPFLMESLHTALMSRDKKSYINRSNNALSPARSELIYSLHWYFCQHTSQKFYNSEKGEHQSKWWNVVLDQEYAMSYSDYYNFLKHFIESEGWWCGDVKVFDLDYDLNSMEIDDLIRLSPQKGDVSQDNLCADFTIKYKVNDPKQYHYRRFHFGHQFSLFGDCLQARSLQARLSQNVSRLDHYLYHSFRLKYPALLPLHLKKNSEQFFLLYLTYLRQYDSLKKRQITFSPSSPHEKANS